MQKLRDFFEIGVRLVWVADSSSRTMYTYRSVTNVRQFVENDSLSCDDVLPSFSTAVKDLIEE
jgi:hypothetical protein